jgi:CRISPR-associated protein Cmr1
MTFCALSTAKGMNINMEKVFFKFKTLTPIFSSGADPKQAEIRPAAVKGLMRYWYRAVLAERCGTLHEKENDIFGSTENSSNVGVRIRENVKTRSRYRFNNNNGLKYLWYSIKMNQNKEGKSHIQANEDFTIELFSRNNAEAIKKGALSLWLMATFGGIGTRSRRGGGNLQITGIEDSYNILSDFNLIFKGSDLEQYIEYIKNTLTSIIKEVDQGDNEEYSVLRNANIYFLDLKDKKCSSSYKCVLNFIGEKFSEFRNRYDDDYTVVKDFLRGKKDNRTIEKVRFGLPIMYKYRSLNGTGGIISATGDIKRRSSPLIIKVIQINKDFYPMLFYLGGKFLPADAKLILKKSKSDHEVKKPLPEGDIINKFINSLEKYSLKEVKL